MRSLPHAAQAARVRHAVRTTRYAVLLPWLALAALTLLGLLLRRYRLGAYGLWFDEADLIARAHEPLAGLLAAFGRPGENGPLYTLLMAAWLRVAGEGELMVRLPSVVAGTLAIPALALLGRALGGWRVGLLAAGLLAISPYAVWYGQDAKMYALLTLLTPAGWWLLLAAVRRDRPAPWLAYGLLTIAGFLVHVSMVLVWLSQVAVTALHWRRLGPARRPWVITTLLLLLPELAVGLGQAGYLLGGDLLGSWQPSVGLGEMLGILAVKLAVNRADPATEWWGALLLAGLALAGLAVWARGGVGAPREAGAQADPPPSLHPAVLLAGALLAPILLFYLITLRVPLFQDRYLIILLPPYLLAAAGAVAWLARRLPPVAPALLAALLLLAWIPLRDVVYAADSQKEDWVGAYRAIAPHVREGDVLLIHPGYLRPTADYYARRLPGLARLPIVTLPSLRTEAFDERELDAVLAGATWGKTRVWLVTSDERLRSDDERDLLRTWYHGNTTLFAARLFNGVRVETFSYNGPYKAGLWRPEIPLRVEFGGEILLLGATWEEEGRRARAGDWALLTLRWRALRPPPASYVVRLRLRDAAGREVAAYDIKPLDGHWPTERWTTREQIWDYHDLFIQPDLPPGRYSVVAGLYPEGRPEAGLRPDTDAAPGDPLGVEVGPLTIVR